MIQCNRCHLQYIGETKRRLKDRFNEHRRSVYKTNIQSKPTTVAEHFLSHPNHCRVSVKCGPDGGGWRMAARKMRMIKCGWKKADDKMNWTELNWTLLIITYINHTKLLAPATSKMTNRGGGKGGKMRMTKWVIKWGWKIANDTMQMIKSQWGKINLRCFLKVSFVNKPSHLIELRSGEDQYFIFNPQTGQNILKPSRRIQKTTDKPWSMYNRIDLYRSTPSFKQVSNAEKHRYN